MSENFDFDTDTGIDDAAVTTVGESAVPDALPPMGSGFDEIDDVDGGGFDGEGPPTPTGFDDPDPDPEPEVRAFGTFFVGPTEFAFPTGSVREVVPYPETVTRVPLCSDAVHGIFSLRGEVLPILDMASLLGLEGTVERERSRVAVIENGDSILGVAIDRTGEVLRPSGDEVHRVEHRRDDSTEIVDGVIELEGEGRFIQTLSADVLGGLPGVPRQTRRTDLDEKAAVAKTFSKAIVFRCGEVELALRIEDVLEIQSDLDVSDSPAYFDHCAGVVLLRGNTYPILDLRAAFGAPCGEAAKRYVFVHLDGERVGLGVDALVETIEYPDEALLDVPRMLSSDLVSVCRNVLEPEPERHILVLSVEDLFEKLGVAGLKDLLAYDQDEVVDEDDGGDELGFFAFRVGGHTLCLSLDEVREVREVGGEVFSAGCGDGDLEGLMNLRGRVLPLIDAKRRLGLDGEASVQSADEDDDARRVALVVEVGDEAFGLVVDAIVDIKRTTSSSVSEAGAAREQRRAVSGFMSFVRSTLMVEGRDGSSEMLVVLDAARLPTTA